MCLVHLGGNYTIKGLNIQTKFYLLKGERSMIKSHEINESLDFAIQIEFESLGNILGDYLIFLELNAIKSRKNIPCRGQTKKLLDFYAEQFDKILSQHKASISSDIKKLTLTLLADWEKKMTA